MQQRINKRDLLRNIKKIAKENGVRNMRLDEYNTVFEATIEAIYEALADGKRVILPTLMTLEPQFKASREAVDPRTQEKIIVRDRVKVKLKKSPLLIEFQDRLNPEIVRLREEK